MRYSQSPKPLGPVSFMALCHFRRLAHIIVLAGGRYRIGVVTRSVAGASLLAPSRPADTAPTMSSSHRVPSPIPSVIAAMTEFQNGTGIGQGPISLTAATILQLAKDALRRQSSRGFFLHSPPTGDPIFAASNLPD